MTQGVKSNLEHNEHYQNTKDTTEHVYSQCVVFFVYRRAPCVTYFKYMRQFLKV